MSKHLGQNLCTLAAIVGALWLFHWTVGAAGGLYPASPQPADNDYYNLLVRGFVKGQLHMDVPVPEALKALPDPYDPTQNYRVRMTDVSYFSDRYYLYFGAAPAVTLLLPYRLLTGEFLPTPRAILIFTSLGFLASVSVWLALRRRYFPDTPGWTAPLGVLVLAVGSTVAVLLRRPYFWELATAGGYAFAMLALLALYGALHSPRRQALGMAAAGLLLGLAVASRPTYVYAVPILALPLLAHAQLHGRDRRWWSMLLAGAAGIGVMGIAVFTYNLARFGSGFDFGHDYLLSMAYESKVRLFGLDYFLFNARMYFLLPGEWTWQPPFFAPVPVLRSEMPREFYTVDDPFGLLTIFPAALLALAAPFALARRSHEERVRLRTVLLAFLLLTVSAAIVILLYVATIPRYAVDFFPALALLSATGLLVVARDRSPGWTPRLKRTGLLLLTAASIAVGTVALFDLGRTLRRTNPELVQHVTRITSPLEVLRDRARGLHYGSVELELRRGSNPAEVETLLVAGDPARPDRVLLDWHTRGRLRLGFQHAATPVQWSERLAVDDGVARLRVELGSFYPPAEHGFFNGVEVHKAAWLQHRVELQLNGQVALRTFAPLDPARRGAPTHAESSFSGQVLAFRRLSADLPQREIDTPANLVLQMPAIGLDASKVLPLLSSGPDNAADVLLLETVQPGQARLGYRAADGTRSWSDAFAFDTDAPHRLEIRQTETGWAQPVAGSRLLALWCDDRLAWHASVPAVASTHAQVVVGENRSGDASIAATFPGLRAVADAAMTGRRGGTLVLRMMLPKGVKGAWRPILSTGHAGAADILSVYYVGTSALQFRFDHWGAPLRSGEMIEVDENIGHDLEIHLPSFAPDRFGQPAEGELWIRLDGREVLRAKVATYGFTPDELVLGENRVRAALDDPLFRGAFIKADWVQ
ncbi:hypothetical protein [Opitutus sp. ER46]|uniref:hypothetical protein n=1 Tax=Opitutus sp. ER46 TaxID=2161864 RepID=UPI000D30E693|nr:hypothetical protein [Opitutus sp. ER46]PTX92583.1 hypothetical protein DB354_14745 [Opitutus sp. ER46]